MHISLRRLFVSLFVVGISSSLVASLIMWLGFRFMLHQEKDKYERLLLEKSAELHQSECGEKDERTMIGVVIPNNAVSGDEESDREYARSLLCPRQGTEWFCIATLNSPMDYPYKLFAFKLRPSPAPTKLVAK